MTVVVVALLLFAPAVASNTFHIEIDESPFTVPVALSASRSGHRIEKPIDQQRLEQQRRLREKRVHASPTETKALKSLEKQNNARTIGASGSPDRRNVGADTKRGALWDSIKESREQALATSLKDALTQRNRADMRKHAEALKELPADRRASLMTEAQIKKSVREKIENFLQLRRENWLDTIDLEPKGDEEVRVVGRPKSVTSNTVNYGKWRSVASRMQAIVFMDEGARPIAQAGLYLVASNDPSLPQTKCLARTHFPVSIGLADVLSVNFFGVQGKSKFDKCARLFLDARFEQVGVETLRALAEARTIRKADAESNFADMSGSHDMERVPVYLVYDAAW